MKINEIISDLSNANFTKKDLKSPLYYPGSKRRFVKNYQKEFPQTIDGWYYEPFLGGGSVLFYLAPNKAIVGDLSEELVNFYRVVRDDLFGFLREVANFKNTKEVYYKVRAWDRDENYKKLSDIKRAARFYYLNQTSYAGLLRVNKAGEMNAPYGYRDKEFVPDLRVLVNVSRYLKKNNVKAANKDYKKLLSTTRRGDFVFLDPPIINNNDLNDKYFRFKDYENLSSEVKKLNDKGVKFLLTTENDKNVRNLFLDYNIIDYNDTRNIAYKEGSRTGYKNICVKNY